MKYFLVLFLIFALKIGAFANNTNSIEIIVAGDIFPSPSLINGGIKKDNSRDYLPYYKYVKDIISRADLSIAWFGGPVAGEGEEFSGYPSYNNPPEFIKAAVEAGFDIFFHTNHLLDRGKKGLLRTIRFFKSIGSIYLGVYENKEESEDIYYFEKNGIKVAILSYLYGANANIKTEKWMINYIDMAKISNDIYRAKEEKADFIIVGLHWGNEYERLPSPQQKKLAKEIASLGADLILGSHPHVIQPAELIITSNNNEIRKTFVIYSFGNFLSSQRKRYTDCGLLARFIIEKNEKTFLKSASYIPTWVKWSFDNKTKKYITRILPSIEFHKKFKNKMTKLISKTEYELMMISLKDTISHINNTNIPFIYEGEF